MKTFKPGDLVEMVFSKKVMNWDRYKQSDPLCGVALVIDGPHHVLDKYRVVTMTYTIRFQDSNKRATVPASMLRPLSVQKD
jgi:hypothetical protein